MLAIWAPDHGRTAVGPTIFRRFAAAWRAGGRSIEVAMTNWDTEMAEHRSAVSRLVAAVQAVPVQRWTAQPAPGKWSPAEVAMHLVLTYEFLAREQQGKGTVPVLVPRWKAWILRRVVLPRLLGARKLPSGVRAPRAVRPSGELPLPTDATKRLEAITAEWEEAMAQNHDRGGGTAVHPFFGALPLPTMLRFATVHADHHCRQLKRASEGLTMHGS